MSTAFQCDACGKFFEGEPDNLAWEEGTMLMASCPDLDVDIRVQITPDGGGDAPDLCSDCIFKLLIQSIKNRQDRLGLERRQEEGQNALSDMPAEF